MLVAVGLYFFGICARLLMLHIRYPFLNNSFKIDKNSRAWIEHKYKGCYSYLYVFQDLYNYKIGFTAYIIVRIVFLIYDLNILEILSLCL